MSFKLNSQTFKRTEAFTKDFQKLDSSEHEYIKERLKKIFTHPRLAQIKKLKGFTDVDYRLRIGKFRLLFTVDKNNKKFIFSRCKKRKDLY